MTVFSFFWATLIVPKETHFGHFWVQIHMFHISCCFYVFSDNFAVWTGVPLLLGELSHKLTPYMFQNYVALYLELYLKWENVADINVAEIIKLMAGTTLSTRNWGLHEMFKILYGLMLMRS